MLVAASKVAEKAGLVDGYRTVINQGKEGCQLDVDGDSALKIHVLGG